MATTYAKIKTDVLQLVPVHQNAAPTGSVFLNKDNSNALSTKTTGGVTVQIGASAASADLMIKSKKNVTGVEIPAYQRVALLPDGSVCLADSNNAAAMTDIGVSMDPIPNDTFGRVLLNGANAQGVVLGLGYAPGDSVYLSTTPGALTNDPSVFDTDTDAVIRVGIADCATEEADGVATDLIMMFEVQSKP